jgi:RimJ/RimL family protein N-acetyltransferase
VTAPRIVQLSTGLSVALRPITVGDRERLMEVFNGLSETSRYHRFLAGKAVLSPGELARYTRVDHSDHEAILAVALPDGRGVGVTRYFRDIADPRVAEVAVAVVDAYQNQGLGTALVRRLAQRAAEEGVRAFRFYFAVSNRRVLRLARRIGRLEMIRHHGGNVVWAELTF